MIRTTALETKVTEAKTSNKSVWLLVGGGGSLEACSADVGDVVIINEDD